VGRSRSITIAIEDFKFDAGQFFYGVESAGLEVWPVAVMSRRREQRLLAGFGAVGCGNAGGRDRGEGLVTARLHGSILDAVDQLVDEISMSN